MIYCGCWVSQQTNTFAFLIQVEFILMQKCLFLFNISAAIYQNKHKICLLMKYSQQCGSGPLQVIARRTCAPTMQLFRLSRVPGFRKQRTSLSKTDNMNSEACRLWTNNRRFLLHAGKVVALKFISNPVDYCTLSLGQYFKSTHRMNFRQIKMPNEPLKALSLNIQAIIYYN